MRIILIAAACFLLFIGCRKGRNSNDLVGTWKLVQMSNVTQVWRNVAATEQSTLIFNSDNTYSHNPAMISSFSGCSGTYRIEPNNMLFMNWSCVSDPNYKDQLIFTRQGNRLILDHITTATGVKTKYEKQ